MSAEEIADVEVVEETPASSPAASQPDPVASASTSTEIATIAGASLMRPVGSVDSIVQAMEEYQSLRQRLITPADVQTIGKKEFVTKSGWRKFALAYSLSIETVSLDLDSDEDGNVRIARSRKRAIAPNGRFVDAIGSCDRYERCCPTRLGRECKNRSKYHDHCPEGCDGYSHFSHPNHDIPATAETRAGNRAISDLAAFGEVSAEEVSHAGEPADRAQVAAITAALNTISAEKIQPSADATFRSVAKHKFIERFGRPDALTAEQIEPARAWVESAGGTFASSTTEPSAAGPTSPSSETQPAPSGLEGAGDESVAVEPSTVTADTGHGDVSPPPTPPSAGVTPPPHAAEAAAPREDVASPAVPRGAAPFVESSKEQRQQIAMRCNDLGIEKDDKAIVVQVLTNFRATSTTQMSKDEAQKMIAALIKIKQGHLAVQTVEQDGQRLRGLVPLTQTGVEWMAAIATHELADAEPH